MKPPRLGRRGVRAVPDFATFTVAFALQLMRITENLSQGNRKCSADQRRKQFF